MATNRAIAAVPTQRWVRPTVEKLTADQLTALRNAIGAMADLTDDRGFQYFAGYHGVPPKAYCKHGYQDRWGKYHGAPCSSRGIVLTCTSSSWRCRTGSRA